MSVAAAVPLRDLLEDKALLPGLDEPDAEVIALTPGHTPASRQAAWTPFRTAIRDRWALVFPSRDRADSDPEALTLLTGLDRLRDERDAAYALLVPDAQPADATT